jgi:hypothetical protein
MTRFLMFPDFDIGRNVNSELLFKQNINKIMINDIAIDFICSMYINFSNTKFNLKTFIILISFPPRQLLCEFSFAELLEYKPTCCFDGLIGEAKIRVLLEANSLWVETSIKVYFWTFGYLARIYPIYLS